MIRATLRAAFPLVPIGCLGFLSRSMIRPTLLAPLGRGHFGRGSGGRRARTCAASLALEARKHAGGTGGAQRASIRAAFFALLAVGAATAQTPEPSQPAGAEPASGQAAFGEDGREGAGGEAAFGEDGYPIFPPGLDPIIAVNPLNPRLNQEQPWEITSAGRVIPQRRAPKPPIPVFRAPLTGAFSSRAENSAIELAFGGQTSLGGTLGVRVSRLETMPAVVELAVGESFALDDLAVRAFDADGEPVARVPLSLEIEGPEGFVDMAAFEQDKRTLSAVARGIGRIWVASLLPTRQNEPFSIPVVLAVRDPGSRGGGPSVRIHENVPAAP